MYKTGGWKAGEAQGHCRPRLRFAAGPVIGRIPGRGRGAHEDGVHPCPAPPPLSRCCAAHARIEDKSQQRAEDLLRSTPAAALEALGGGLLLALHPCASRLDELLRAKLALLGLALGVRVGVGVRVRGRGMSKGSPSRSPSPSPSTEGAGLHTEVLDRG